MNLSIVHIYGKSKNAVSIVFCCPFVSIPTINQTSKQTNSFKIKNSHQFTLTNELYEEICLYLFAYIHI